MIKSKSEMQYKYWATQLKKIFINRISLKVTVKYNKNIEKLEGKKPDQSVVEERKTLEGGSNA